MEKFDVNLGLNDGATLKLELSSFRPDLLS
jgi:hypothetical protein